MQERIAAQNWHIKDLKPDPKNPRKNEAAVPGVKESIRTFGFRVPIIIDKDGNIVAGHTRYLAAQELGLEEVPAIVADQLTPKQLKAFQLADNKVAEFSKWDNALLFGELDDLAGIFDMTVFGFNMKPESSKAKEKKDPQWVICPRCGARIPRVQAVGYSPDDWSDAE